MSKLTFVRPEWMASGRCAEVDPELFFAEYKGDKHAKVAKTICVNCEVKDTCLEYAMSVLPVDDYGIWGGTTEAERKRMRAARKGVRVIDLTDAEIDLTLDIRDYLEEEDEPAVVLLPLENNDFDIDEAAEEAALEAEIERELTAA